MNKTFTKIAVMLAAGLAIATAEAKYLYAMVGDAENVYNGQEIDFNYAMLSAYDGTQWSYLDYYTFKDGRAVKSETKALAANSGYGDTTGAVYFDIGGTGEQYQTFLFELYTSSTGAERVGWQQYSLATVRNSLYENVPDSNVNTPFKVSQVIPEPTSGILLLLGMAGLALRRRRA